ncbi:MAG: 50S ribosomal protein L30e [Promethearchaeota archaeon]
MDAETAIRLSVKSGRTVLGTRRALHLLRVGFPRVIILAGNTQPEVVEKISALAKTSQVPIHHYKSNSWDLGQLCGRPHMVTALTVLEPGDADISILTGAD